MSEPLTFDKRMYHLIQCRYALKLQATTGLKHSKGSVIKLVQRMYDVPTSARTAKAAQLEVEKILARNYNWTP